ncbi:hypothetical protein BJX66DRAFT_343840 [Aspergillus keveii]|uniref:Cysteine-rich transmembrane CYSTM domain-containing protein n=1 Tax=Aspergillus keveii TaxID=714993 RepID=A0ABR4FN38_9EURO
MSYQQQPYGEHPPYQQPYGYPPPQQGPPMQYQQPPQTVIVQEEKKDRGCLATCLATIFCCWLCGETCECCFDCLTCCC